MKKIIKYNFIYPFILLLATACSDKYQSLYDAAPTPGLYFSKDSVKIREKDYFNISQSNNGKLSFYCKSANTQLNLQLTDTSKNIHILYRGTDLVNNGPLPVMDSIQVFCTCDTPGIYSVDCLLTDRLGKVSEKTLLIVCKANQPAQPDFFASLVDNSITQNWVYQFNASASKKTDGIILQYHFLINGVQYDSNSPFFNWTFHANGPQDIGLFLTDDLGVNSETLHTHILIQ